MKLLLFPWDRRTLGHLARCLALAIGIRSLDPSVEIVFQVPPGPGPRMLEYYDFPFEEIRSPRPQPLSLLLADSLKRHQPDIAVFDRCRPGPLVAQMLGVKSVVLTRYCPPKTADQAYLEYLRQAHLILFLETRRYLMRLRLPNQILSKTFPVGYPLRTYPHEVPHEIYRLPGQRPAILVMVGGGPQGAYLIGKALRIREIMSMSGLPPSLTIVPGLSITVTTCLPPGVSLEVFTPNTMGLILQSDLVISLAGFNTLMEVASARKPMVVTPLEGNPEQQYNSYFIERSRAGFRLDPQCGAQKAVAIVAEALEKPLPAMHPEIEALTEEGNRVRAASVVLQCCRTGR